MKSQNLFISLLQYELILERCDDLTTIRGNLSHFSHQYEEYPCMSCVFLVWLPRTSFTTFVFMYSSYYDFLIIIYCEYQWSVSNSPHEYGCCLWILLWHNLKKRIGSFAITTDFCKYLGKYVFMINFHRFIQLIFLYTYFAGSEVKANQHIIIFKFQCIHVECVRVSRTASIRRLTL